MLYYFALNCLFGFSYFLARTKTFNRASAMLIITQAFTLPVFILSELWIEGRVIKGEIALGADKKEGNKNYSFLLTWSNAYIILFYLLLSKLFDFEGNIIVIALIIMAYHFLSIGYFLKLLNDNKLFGLLDILCYLYCGYLLILYLF